ncbi:MAG: nitroreductase family protein [Gemmatimonadota bacterium]
MSSDAGKTDEFEPLSTWREYPPEEMHRRAVEFHTEMARRRTTRHFSDRPVQRSIIEECVRTAGTAPSGAHQQPWHFVVISAPALKRRIRDAAEASEREFYATAPQEWLDALAPLGTDSVKEYLETAPHLIAVFAQRHGVGADGTLRKHYYVSESVGIASGFLLAALHHAGLATLTHTPSPMGFLNEVLDRPSSEKAMMLVVTGYPALDARVPRLLRKGLEEIASFR